MASDLAPIRDKTLPHSLDAEKTVLGAILVENTDFNGAAELLSRDDFYREGHRRIYEAMSNLAEKSQPIDLVTLKEELTRLSALEAAGGVAYLGALLDGVPRITNIQDWCRIIKEKAVLRNLIHASNRISQWAYEAEQDPAQILDQAEKAIFEIAERRIRQGFVAIREIVKESFRTIDQLSQSQDAITGIATGFVDLDDKTSGLQKSDLIILAARPAMGKTSLCLNIAQHASLKGGETVGIFSLEMSKEQLVLRMLCADARIDSHRLKTGRLQEKDWARLAKAYADLSASKIFIDDSATITPLEIRAKCRRLKAEHGLGLVIIDYLQLVTGSGRIENRQQEVASISRSFKGLAKELDVPVIALSQLSRAPEARTDKRPQLSDLRECVTGDTLVVLADGRRVPISGLVGTKPEVVSVSRTGRLISARSDKVWSVGRRAIYALRLSNGRNIRATGKHRLLGQCGWRRIDELLIGDQLAFATDIPTRLIRAESTDDASRADDSNDPTASIKRVVAADDYDTHFNLGIAYKEMGLIDEAIEFQITAGDQRRAYESSNMLGLCYTAKGMPQIAAKWFARGVSAPAQPKDGLSLGLLEDSSDESRNENATELSWHRIESIEPAGEEEVFDLTVPGPASWLADGIVSHNSGSIEQDADIVMFIYREEEHKASPENQGIAKLIIAKQRNGPTGEVNLAFIKEFTRFENLQWQSPTGG